MSKLVISKLFLYRYRFLIGYTLLGLAFVALVFLLPTLSPAGLSSLEQRSAVASYNLHFSSITSGDLIDLPYHVLQKICILLFGFSTYTITLPSLIIGLLLGFLIILLLNRWFKSNVALLASILTVLSTPFLYLAGSGTPLIMLVFWPTLLLWLGSKIQGDKSTSPVFSLIFALSLLLSIYTPHLIYLVIFIIIFAIWNPHLRYTIKTLPRLPMLITLLIILAGFGIWLTNLISSSSVALSLFFARDFSFANFIKNIHTGLTPFFSFSSSTVGVFLSPMFSLAGVALAATGLFSTRKGFFASRNAIASCFIVFAVVLSGLTPDSSLLLILPFAILTAHGLRYLLEKWYGLFPLNPYARIFAIFPLSILLALMLVPNLTHFIYGYRYSPAVANEFSSDLQLVQTKLAENTYLYLPKDTLDYHFYNVYEDRHHLISIISDFNSMNPGIKYDIATLGYQTDLNLPENYHLSRIITSPKSDNSDRIYIYKYISSSN